MKRIIIAVEPLFYNDNMIDFRMEVRLGDRIHISRNIITPDIFKSRWDCIFDKLKNTLREMIESEKINEG